MTGCIIVPLDGSARAERAVPAGAALASQAGLGVRLLSVVDRDRDVHEHQVYPKEVASELAVDDVDTVVRISDDPADVIATFNVTCQRLEGGLVAPCMSTHGRGALRGAVLGSVATGVVRDLHEPVFLIGPRCQVPEHRTVSRIETIVVALDGSSYAQAIVPDVLRWARALHARVNLVSVVSPTFAEETASAMLPEGDILEAGHLHAAFSAVEEAGIDGTWDTLHSNHPHEAITAYAQDLGNPLIAMTTHGRSARWFVPMGSIATAMVRTATCPVLLLQPALVRT